MWDLFYPFVYGSAPIFSLWILRETLGRQVWNVHFSLAWLILPAALVIFADWTENGTQLEQLRRFITCGEFAVLPERLRVASAAAIVKILFLGISGGLDRFRG